MNTATIIAIDSDDSAANLIAYWRLSGSADQDTFQEALTEAGAGVHVALPKVPSPNEALKRAMDAVASSHDQLVRRHKAGYLLVNESETEDGEDLSYSTSLRVWWEGTRKEGHLSWSNPDHPMVSTIVEKFRFFRTHITSREITTWLPVCARLECDAVSLRPNGGMYFVPNASRAKWVRIVDAVQEATGCKFYEIPALTTDSALEAIMDAVIAESERLESEMDSALGLENVGKRRLDTLEKQCAAFAAKLVRYETLLGQKLPEVTDKLMGLNCAITDKLCNVDLSADKKAVKAA